jgi:hypothetical protein
MHNKIRLKPFLTIKQEFSLKNHKINKNKNLLIPMQNRIYFAGGENHTKNEIKTVLKQYKLKLK